MVKNCTVEYQNAWTETAADHLGSDPKSFLKAKMLILISDSWNMKNETTSPALGVQLIRKEKQQLNVSVLEL